MSPVAAGAAGLCVLLLVVFQALPPPSSGLRPPRVIAATQAGLERNADLRVLVEAVHRDVDAVVVLSGGSSTMSEAKRRDLLAMFAALGALGRERRIVVGDGGIRAGITEAAGQARLASEGAFMLVGVAPAREIAPRGQTPVDPNHSHIVAVDDPALPADAASWGSETAAMYWLFNRFAEGRNSVAIVANGGGIALHEIAANVEAGRPMILIEGSGRAADAMIALLRGTMPPDGEVAALLARARQARVTRRPDLFTIVPVTAGASGLLEALRTTLGPVLPRTP
jgi:hypothetical protein